MRFLGYVARRQLARRWLSTVALVVLVAIGSGAVMALAAGARRTQAAFPEFVQHAAAQGDATVYHDAGERPLAPDPQAASRAALAELDIVDAAVRGGGFLVQTEYRDGSRQRSLATLPLDPGGTEALVGRPIVVDGRWPDDDDPVGVAVDEELAARAGLAVGSSWRIAPYTFEQLELAGGGADVDAAGTPVDLEVRAIVRQPQDLHPVDLARDGIYVDRSELFLTPAFWEANGPDLARYGIGTLVDLAPGATVEDLEPELDAALGPDTWFVERSFGAVEALGGLERAVELEARGLQAVAAATAVAAVGLLSMLAVRLASVEQHEGETLHALGLGRRDVRWLALLRGAAIGLAGAAAGAAAAVAASRWTPVGIARRAELHPGVEADLTVLALGCVATVVTVAALHVAAAGLAASRRPSSRPTGVPLLGRSATLGATARAGLGFALTPERGGRSVPARAALAGTAAAVAVAIAGVVAAASFDAVEDDPSRHGVYWQASVGNYGSTEEANAAADLLSSNPDVAGHAGQTYNEVIVDGQLVSTLTVFDGPGDLEPVILEGRSPTGPGEIALGRIQMERFRVGVGDTVPARMSVDEPVPLRVVGRALVGELGDPGGNGNPAKGAIIHAAALAELDPLTEEPPSPQWHVVRFTDGVDPEQAIERLEADFPLSVTVPVLPTDLANLGRLGGSVRLLVALVGVLGAGAALLATVGAVHRRRNELAVLRTLGFRPIQSAAAIAWQAATFGVLGLAVGLPAGVIAGRWGWTTVASDAGVESGPVIPMAALAALIVAVFVVLEALAAVPAAIASRLRPADVLRTE